MYQLNSSPTITTAVRKINTSGSQVWMTAVGSAANLKSLAVDSSETSIYFATASTSSTAGTTTATTSNAILQLTTSTGAIESQQGL